jgi:hypothetical protein
VFLKLKLIGESFTFSSTLLRRRKGAPQKVRVALRLRMDTTMNLSWIADRLRMGGNTRLLNPLLGV